MKPLTLDGHRMVWIAVRYLCPQRDMPDDRNAYGELVHTLGGVSTNPQILRPWLHLAPDPVIDANKCRFINVAVDDIATTIAGAQDTLGPFGIVV